MPVNRIQLPGISFSGRLAQNTAALYAVQFAEYLLPMLTVPYLSRKLGAGAWGEILYAQGFAGWLAILLEYGFGLSATRTLARLDAQDHAGRGRLVAGVVGASLLLMVAAIGVCLISAFTVPIFEERPSLLVLGAAIAFSQGLRPFWYFQGRENLAPLSALNFASRVFNTFGVFLVVFEPAHAWRVLLLQALAGVAILAVALRWIYADTPWQRPTLALALETLREGWSLFMMRSSISLYSLANVFLLGLFVNAQQVAFYAGPERLNKAATGILQPLISVLYPRINALIAQDVAVARRAARKGLLLIGGLGLTIGLGLFVAAPVLIRVLGKGYEPAIPVFRVMGLLAPLVAFNTVLGAQWLIPLGYDRIVNRIILLAGVLNVVAACLAAAEYGPMGMAWCVVGAETLILGGLLVAVRSVDPLFFQLPKR